MINSRENFYKAHNFLIVLIASTIFFRSFCSLLIILYVIYNLLHIKHLEWQKKTGLYLGLILAFPLIFEILFFWNNSSINLGFKSLEKSLSFLVFPFFVLGSYKYLDFYKIANFYRHVLTSILIFLLIRFLFVHPELVQKYINGIHLWEMGYKFSESFNNHAPAVNLHIAFVVMLNVYFLIRNYKHSKWLNLLVLILSIIELLIVNTRIALVTTIIGAFLIVLHFVLQSTNRTKVIKGLVATVFVVGMVVLIAFKTNPYMKEKYSKATFAHLEKIGKLDEIKNPEAEVFNAFVTRLSIWKSAVEVGMRHPFIGYGSSDGKKELIKYFKETNQHFLAKYEFPVHNQLLDLFIKYGILGLILGFGYFLFPIIIGIKSKNILICCFGVNFFVANMFDDFLIRFDGIVFCAIWFSLSVVYYLQKRYLV